MSNHQTFHTDRLFLRPTGVEDAAFVLALQNTLKWLKYIGDRNTKTIEDARRYIESKMLPQLEQLGFGNYTVIRSSDNKKIGTCGLYDRPGIEGVDLGFAFLPMYEGQGYALESAEAIKKAAFEDFRLEKIHAITAAENISSQKLLKKLQFEYLGNIKIPNDSEELMHYICRASKVPYSKMI